MTGPRQGRTPAAAPASWSYRPAVTRLSSLLTFTATGYALYWGWTHREHAYLTPAEGTGYALGIAGASLMLLLALYPARKHAGFMRHWGALRHWFRMHMVFGIAGPVAILYHCNFSTGATNSNIALFSMLVVASSGLVGRYLYSSIHQGLYGQHLRLEDVRDGWVAARQRMQGHGQVLQLLEQQLAGYEQPLQDLRRTLLSSVARWLRSLWQRAVILAMARHGVRHARLPAAEAAGLLGLLQARVAAANRVYRYNAFERLFALWHLLHLPLFLMLIVTGVVHVVAVHLY